MTTQQIIDVLNESLQLDRAAMSVLVGNRVPCNRALADHPTVMVAGDGEQGPFLVGLLGILQGIAGIDGDIIEAVFDTETASVIKLTGFRLRERQPTP